MPVVDDYEAFWEGSLDRLEARLRQVDWSSELTQADRERLWRDFERRAARSEDETLAPDPVDDGPAGALPTVAPQEERAARRDLLEQVGRLESDLAALFCSAYPRGGFDWRVPSRGGPRMLSLYELEQVRDDLAERLHDVRRTLSDRTWVEEQNRGLIEEMMLEPEKHKWVRVGAEDIGERGCKHWHVQPRWGILGMMLNWWRVRISSGCPLPTSQPLS